MRKWDNNLQPKRPLEDLAGFLSPHFFFGCVKESHSMPSSAPGFYLNQWTAIQETNNGSVLPTSKTMHKIIPKLMIYPRERDSSHDEYYKGRILGSLHRMKHTKLSLQVKVRVYDWSSDNIGKSRLITWRGGWVEFGPIHYHCSFQGTQTTLLPIRLWVNLNYRFFESNCSS